MSETTLYHRRIPEDRLEGRPLGRHVLHDVRSRKFPAATADKITSVLHEAVGLPLNQVNVGKCTCEALAAAKNSQPDYKSGDHVLDDTDTDTLYELETRLEGQPWSPSNPTANDIGGSGLMVCRAAKKLGWIKSYRHAFGLEHALRALVLRPVIFGVDWYDGFDRPDSQGIVKMTGSVRGGHEICADEIDEPRGLVGFWQSWGAWGLDGSGRFYMPMEVVDRLLSEQGDATVPYV